MNFHQSPSLLPRRSRRAAACLAALLLAGVAGAQQPMTIDQLFLQLDSGNRTLLARQSAVEAATHGVSEAKSQRLPDINASLSASYNGNVVLTDRDLSNVHGYSSPHLGNSFALEAQQTVYSGGALSAGIRMAELSRDMSQTTLELSRTQQRFLALGQFLDLFKIDNQLKVYASNIALTRQLIADIESKREQGMALRNDVTRYELQMENLLLGERRLRDQRAILNYQLCHTLGIDEVQITPDSASITRPLPTTEEADWQHRAALTAPSVRLSQLGCLMAEQQLRLAKSELLPKVALFAGDTFNGPFTYDIPPIDKNVNVFYVGIGVKYSLSSLFKANKGVRRATVQLSESRRELDVASERLSNDMQQAHTLYLQAYADLATQRKSVELARQNYQVMNERYLNQLALVTDMVDASNAKLNAELLETNALTSITYAYYRMLFVSGEI